jgi:RNA polymerase primary sigma factor
MEGAGMRSSKNLAQNLVKAAPVAAPTADLASIGLLEDDGAEETAIRPRPTEVLDDEPAAEFIDLEFTPIERAPEPVRARELPARELRDVEEGGGDSMLARYFRDMALHPVMGPDEELETAKTVERSELDHWTALLSYLPVAEHVLTYLEEQVAKAGEEEVQGAAAARARQAREALSKKQKDKLTSEQQKQWDQLTLELCTAIRLPDSDRIWMAKAARSPTISAASRTSRMTSATPRKGRRPVRRCRCRAITGASSTEWSAPSRCSTTRRTASSRRTSASW